VSLIQNLLTDTWARVGDQQISTHWGVPQGGVLSPTLFNVYLEEALKSKTLLWQAAQRGNLLAYADTVEAAAAQLPTESAEQEVTRDRGGAAPSRALSNSAAVSCTCA
jgi:hypothetical protein